jgi:hypothetical protein
MIAAYPQADSALEDENAEAQIKAMQDIVGVARSMRDSYGLKPSMRPVLFVKCRSKVESMREEADNIKTLVKCESVTVMGDGEEPDKGCGEHMISVIIYIYIYIYIIIEGHGIGYAFIHEYGVLEKFIYTNVSCYSYATVYLLLDTYEQHTQAKRTHLKCGKRGQYVSESILSMFCLTGMRPVGDWAEVHMVLKGLLDLDAEIAKIEVCAHLFPLFGNDVESMPVLHLCLSSIALLLHLKQHVGNQVHANIACRITMDHHLL